MARYKFVAKMFVGRTSVLEIGCGDAFCAPTVCQAVEKLTVTDFDPLYIEDAKSRMSERWRFDAVVIDIARDQLPGRFDGIYSLDSHNIPFVSKLLEGVTGGKMFLAELFFVLTREIPNLRFGAPVGPYSLLAVPLRAAGRVLGCELGALAETRRGHDGVSALTRPHRPWRVRQSG